MHNLTLTSYVFILFDLLFDILLLNVYIHNLFYLIFLLQILTLSSHVYIQIYHFYLFSYFHLKMDCLETQFPINQYLDCVFECSRYAVPGCKY